MDMGLVDSSTVIGALQHGASNLVSEASSLFGNVTFGDQAGDQPITDGDILWGSVFIFVGLVMCTLGYRLFKPMLFVVGFGGVGGLAGYYIYHNVEDRRELYSVLGGVGAGLIAGYGLLRLLLLGIFAVGAALGLVASVAALQALDGSLITSEWGQIAFMVACTIIGGLIALWLEKPVLILATSVVGSYVFCSGINRFTHSTFNGALKELLHGRNIRDTDVCERDCYLLLGTCVALAIVGVGVQLFWTAKGFSHRKDAEKERERYAEDHRPLLVHSHREVYGHRPYSQEMYGGRYA